MIDLPVRVDGARVVARAWAGDGPPVVLVHGLAISGAYFWPLADRLAPACAVWVPDLPGSGRSGRAPGPPTVENLAGWLAEWMDAVGLPAAAFVANSFGCQVVAELAWRAPERVRSMIWLGPAIDARASLLVQGARLAACAVREPLALVGRFVIDALRYGPLRAIRTFLLARRHPFLERLAEVRAPTLVVRGAGDLLTTDRFARELAATLPCCTYLERPGAHAVHFEDPDGLADALRPYLGRE